MKTASPLAGAGGGGDAEGHTSTSSWRGAERGQMGSLLAALNCVVAWIFTFFV